MPGFGVNSAMCVPILPETDHPTRKALQPTFLSLPIPNCYYHSHNSTHLLEVTRVGDTNLSEIRLSIDELERLDKFGLEDETMSTAVRRTLKPRPNSGRLSQRMYSLICPQGDDHRCLLGPMSHLQDIILPLPKIPSRTRKTSISTSPSSLNAHSSKILSGPFEAVGYNPLVRTTPTSSYGSILASSTRQCMYLSAVVHHKLYNADS